MTEANTPRMGRYSAGWRSFPLRLFANYYFRRSARRRTASEPVTLRNDSIAKARPVMLIEGPKELGPAMKAYLSALDYVMVDGFVDNPALIDEIAWDTVAIPRERWK